MEWEKSLKRKQSITGGQLQVQVELSKQEILEETDPLKTPINRVQKTY